MRSRTLRTALATGALACASTSGTVKPSVDPARTTPPPIEVPRDAVPPPPRPREIPAKEAHARDWMAQGSTGVPAFRRTHPTYDGRGVLIGILDSGIDAGIPGLATTTTAERKILDLRDFSGEGAITLARLAPTNDSVSVGGQRLAGFGRVASLNATGPYYGGVLQEIPLGSPPASDVNGNGRDADTLAVVVTRASDGWVLFADTDGDGSLANERAVHDFLIGKETFGWAPRGQATPLTAAVNFREEGGEPKLDLLFDTSGHGSHVAGIAAGHDIYGVPGFDGVAPGAQLLGLKIANNAQGGLSVTGSMMKAIDYALRFAQARRLPLVLNMSFGVGNELEGTARIDQLIDSVLALHPELVFTVSGGNDGPGLSTLGFPGSANRVISVGGIFPSVFIDQVPANRSDEVIAYFSSRGGELAQPNIVTPAMAYSTVPGWKTGEERAAGTSMAAPHAAGLAALLISAMKQEGSAVEARYLKQALMVTAQPLAGGTQLDEGSGLPLVGAAYQWLKGGHQVPDVDVRSATGGISAWFSIASKVAGTHTGPAQIDPEFVLTRPANAPEATYRLRSDSPWLAAPASVTLSGATTTLKLSIRPQSVESPGAYTGTVTAWSADTMAGPIFRLVSTVVAPYAPGANANVSAAAIPPGSQRRVFFAADSARAFAVEVSTPSRRQRVLAYLHEPGGMPYRGEHEIPAGFAQDAGVFQIDGRDALAGVYEVDAITAPNQTAAAAVRVIHSPVLLGGKRDRTGVVATVRNPTASAISAAVRAAVVGAERVVPVVATGSEVRRIPFRVPSWATRAEIDVRMDRAQWSRFTDFGVTLFDSLGRQLGKSPLNYAFGRLSVKLEPERRGIPVELGLFPGFAEVGDGERWTVTVSIRLYGDLPHELSLSDTGGSATIALEPQAFRTLTFAMGDSPWTLGDAFFPLGLIAAETGGRAWTHEVGLPPPTPPLMR